MEDDSTHVYETISSKIDQGEASSSNQPPNIYMKLQKNTETGTYYTAGWVADGEVELHYVKGSSQQKEMMKCLIAMALMVMLVVLVMTIVTFSLALFNYSIISSGELTNEDNIISGQLEQLRIRNETQDALKEQDNIISGQVNLLRNETLEIERQLTNKDNIISGQLNQLRNETREAQRQLTNDISALTMRQQHSLASTRDNISQVLNNLNTIENDVSSLQLQLYCGDGQWNRIAFLNMSDSSQQCPSNWKLFTSSGVRACGRQDSSGSSCSGTFYSAKSAYNRVCGRVIGYQFNSPDGFGSMSRGIDGVYMDGVSITCGRAPRNHIWSYVAGVTEHISRHRSNNCPCSTQGGRQPQSFVGDNYYCESGNPTDNVASFYANDKLWDGKRCEGTCCTSSNFLPWFSVYLPSPTTKIEVRICGSEGTENENTPIELLEIYVQ